MKNVTAAVITLLLFSTGASSLPVLAQKHDVSGAGSSFAAAAYTSWGFTYSKEKQVNVNYSSTGSGDGIKQVEARTVDFGASDYALPDEELKKNGLIQFPTLVGGVVPAVNLPGVKAGQLKLTGPILAAIYSGRLTSWNDAEIQTLNPTIALPNIKIRRIVRADDSGSTASFTEYLSKVDPAWASAIGSGLRVNWPRGAELAKGNDGMAAAITAASGAIGYAATNQVAKSKLTYVSLQNQSKHFVLPTDAALNAAVRSTVVQRGGGIDFINAPGLDAWPITDATYILIERTPKNPERARSVLRFFYWAFLRGDAMASESGYVPLPPAIQARVVGMFHEVQDQQGNTLDFMGAGTRGSSMLIAWHKEIPVL